LNLGKAAQTLVEYWRAQGLSLPAGCDREAIGNFERAHRVALPAEMSAYLMFADGMQQTFRDAWDKDGFAFYPLSAIGSVPEIGQRYNPPLARFSSDEDFFIFADYLQVSWSYAIRLRGEGNRIVIVGKEIPEIVAESFQEFVALYVTGSKRLYAGTAASDP